MSKYKITVTGSQLTNIIWGLHKVKREYEYLAERAQGTEYHERYKKLSRECEELLSYLQDKPF